ncbi:Nif11-like leader peptide family natural product precursor [Nostoc sp. 'Lobaria pulmonaria (5183) cyanobiont']|nr:Nif11-like leader peptide family natural product precursor [Nostoc sp. 'Lobaria pulmonaria (5183) cyanobiont']AVH72626.1 bacteriocin propeptide/nitrogen fixation protein of unknown function Nif11 [Nostoc sp. 'Lobaria pulmonaria (5183) cyanobiont']
MAVLVQYAWVRDFQGINYSTKTKSPNFNHNDNHYDRGRGGCRRQPSLPRSIINEKLLVLKNILLFFFILRVASEDQILNMAFEQIEAFLKKMQSEPELKNEVLAAPTADDIARIALKLGFEFSGDELLRMSGKKVGSITVRKTDLPGEYN